MDSFSWDLDGDGIPDQSPEQTPAPGLLPPGRFRPGRRLGRFLLQEELGRGGMGIVFRAQETTTGRDVALKLLHTLEPSRVERLEREAQATASLKHPGVVRIHDAGLIDGSLPFIAYALVEGGRPLRQLFEADLPVEAWVALIRELLSALAAAHDAGLVHRDVKPGNILVDDQMHPHLLDFGLVHLRDATQLTPTGALVGTPLYMAPEQFCSATATPPADVWAVGVILYRALTDEPPFKAGSLHELAGQVLSQQSPRAPRQLRPKIPPGLDSICMRALRFEPERRYPHAGAMLDDLDRFVARQPLDPETLRRPPSRFLRLALATAALLALVSTALLLLRVEAPPEPLPAPPPTELETLRRTVAGRPDDPRPLRRLVRLLIERGELERAAPRAQRLERLEPGPESALLELARLLAAGRVGAIRTRLPGLRRAWIGEPAIARLEELLPQLFAIPPSTTGPVDGLWSWAVRRHLLREGRRERALAFRARDPTLAPPVIAAEIHDARALALLTPLGAEGRRALDETRELPRGTRTPPERRRRAALLLARQPLHLRTAMRPPNLDVDAALAQVLAVDPHSWAARSRAAWYHLTRGDSTSVRQLGHVMEREPQLLTELWGDLAGQDLTRSFRSTPDPRLLLRALAPPNSPAEGCHDTIMGALLFDLDTTAPRAEGLRRLRALEEEIRRDPACLTARLLRVSLRLRLGDIHELERELAILKEVAPEIGFADLLRALLAARKRLPAAQVLPHLKRAHRHGVRWPENEAWKVERTFPALAPYLESAEPHLLRDNR